MKMRTVILSVCIGFIAAWTACAQDPSGTPAVPRFINYQGRLLDNEGVPRVGEFYITFSLQKPDGFQVWTETHEVTLENDHSGLFSVLLGSNEPLELSDFPIDDDGDFGDVLRYLQVSIAEDPESDPIPLTPRKEFVSVAYAFRASDADTLDGWHSVEITGEGWDEVTTLKTLEEHLLAGGNPHDHGGLTGREDDDHLQYHNDERGDIRYGGDGWDHDTQLVDAQNHIANDHNMGEEAPELNERGEPTGQEIRDWADDITQWGHSEEITDLNANYLQGYTAEELISEAKKKDEDDPQVADDLLDNYVPRWDDDLPNGQNDDVGMLVTSIIYVDPGADDTGVADDLVGIGTQNPAGKLEIEDLQDVALVLNSGSDKEAVVQLRENDSPMWTIGNDGDDEGKLKMSTSGDLEESRLTVIRGGNVGIGTDDPATRLHVVGDDTGAETAITVQNEGVAVDDAVAVVFGHGDQESSKITVIKKVDGDGNDVADLKIESRGASGLNQNQLYLKSDGKVGIGTDDPEQALEVNGNIKLTGDGGIYRVDGRLELQTTEDNDIAIMPDGDGNVGVGTETPGRMLHVDGEVQGDRFFGSDDDSNFLDLDNDDDALLSAKRDVIVNADADSDDAGAISLRTKGATRVYVKNDGKVGVGDTSPDYKLDVAGTINADAQVALRASGNSAVEYSSSLFSWGKDGTKNYFEDPVGIGTDEPGYMLDIRRNHDGLRLRAADSAASYEGVVFYDHDGVTRNAGIRAHTARSAGEQQNDLEIWTENGGDVVLGGGNVGVRTDSPQAMLHVNGDIKNSEVHMLANTINEFRSQANDGTLWLNWAGYNGGTSYYRDLRVGDGKHGTVLSVDGSRSMVGINTTTPDAPLDIEGVEPKVRITSTRTGTSWDIEARNPTAILSFKENGTDRMTLKTGGNVGIGTTSPGFKLEVAGSAWIHDNVFANRVGAGTTSPGLPLDVVGLARIGSQDMAGYGTLRVKTRSDAGGFTAWFEAIDSRRALGIVAGSSYHLIQSDSSGSVGPVPIGFRIAGSAPGQFQLGITQTGVGVNTMAPAYPLDVNGDAAVRGALNLYSGDYRIVAKTSNPALMGSPMLAMAAYKPSDYWTVLVPASAGFTVSDPANTRPNMALLPSGGMLLWGYLSEGSDSRIKLDQEGIDYGITEIMALQPKRYTRIDIERQPDTGKIITDKDSDGVVDIGLVAQEVYDVIPEAACPPEDESREIWTLSYSKITTVLVKAVQEQQEQIEQQQQQINALRAELDALKSRVE